MKSYLLGLTAVAGMVLFGMSDTAEAHGRYGGYSRGFGGGYYGNYYRPSYGHYHGGYYTSYRPYYGGYRNGWNGYYGGRGGVTIGTPGFGFRYRW